MALVIAAVLRSWQERFRARLLSAGVAGIQLLAPRPATIYTTDENVNPGVGSCPVAAEGGWAVAAA